MIKFYCDECCDTQEVEIEPITKNELNDKPWGDIFCSECGKVLVTVESDTEGHFIFVETGSKEDVYDWTLQTR